MHECSDYDKIKQLLKSKDDYNIVLGLQLAKGMGLKLDELIERLIFNNNIQTHPRTFGLRIELDKNYKLYCCRQLHSNDWLFQITENNRIDWAFLIDGDCDIKSWYNAKEKCINEFINLILT